MQNIMHYKVTQSLTLLLSSGRPGQPAIRPIRSPMAQRKFYVRQPLARTS